MTSQASALPRRECLGVRRAKVFLGRGRDCAARADRFVAGAATAALHLPVARQIGATAASDALLARARRAADRGAALGQCHSLAGHRSEPCGVRPMGSAPNGSAGGSRSASASQVRQRHGAPARPPSRLKFGCGRPQAQRSGFAMAWGFEGAGIIWRRPSRLGRAEPGALPLCRSPPGGHWYAVG